MRWYVTEFGERSFKYPIDWIGFNLPIHIIKSVHEKGISDPNMYDNFMIGIHDMINVNNPNSYLVGTCPKTDAFDHEFAHAVYFVNVEYRGRVNCIIRDNIDDEQRTQLTEILSREGYNEQVHDDEINAYLTTGDNGLFKSFRNKLWYKNLKKDLLTLHKQYVCVPKLKK